MGEVRVSTLTKNHLDDLRGSGLTDETIATLGFHSADEIEVHEILGFNAGPGLVFPYSRFGEREFFARVKPDDPPVIEGKTPKYLSPKGRGLRLYIPPASQEALNDPTTRILMTEGEKKAAKADQEGFPTIGLGGIYGFRDREHVFLPELNAIRWKTRDVLIVPDSDVHTNTGVRDAVWELGFQLLQRGANSLVVVLPPGDDDSKQGLDDFIVNNGRAAFEELCVEC